LFAHYTEITKFFKSKTSLLFYPKNFC